MGTSTILDKEKKTIIWLDKKVLNKDNKFILEAYLPRLKNYNFFRIKSVIEIFEYIKKHLDYFEFKHFYIIVSGSLAEEFYNEYVKKTEEYNIIATTIVYCYNQKYYETKPYYKDKFLNSGGITSDFEDVVNYILKDEINLEKKNQNYVKYIPNKETFGNVFMNVDPSQEYELAFAIFIGRIINSSLLEEGDISKFQTLLLSRYCKNYISEYLNLIKPNVEIPLHMLSKCFLKFYTLEGPFYRNLNLDLTNDKFDDYLPFIFLQYEILNKGFIKSYRKKLYRGGKLSQEEFNEIISAINKQKYNYNKEKLFFFSKNFLSFSKTKHIAHSFLNNDNKSVTVLFILEEPKDKDFFLTNLDIESLSAIPSEKEVLMLPLTCFEIVKIDDEDTYKNVKYRKIYLKYLDKYQKSIIEKIDYLKESQNEIELKKFFENSMKNLFGQIVKKCYDKNNKITTKYCKIIGASADNDFFLSQIGTSFISKICSLGKINDQAGMHVDDEAPNMIFNEKDKNNKILELCKTFGKEFKRQFHKYKHDNFDPAYSIGICLGNFLINWRSFKKAPTKEKAINIASLALACGPPIVKLIPEIKSQFFNKIVTSNLNVGDIFNGLNILYAVGFEMYSIFSFHFNHKKQWNLTRKYLIKSVINLGVSVSFSIIGNLAIKAALIGVKIFLGFSLGPFGTIVCGLVGGIALGILGKGIGNYLSDKAYGKDQFILISAHLYFKYIPDKYRKEGNNPHLQWNKTYLCDNVESYIIECIINETDIIMRVMNIPKDVYELEECLGYEIKQNNNIINEDDDCEYSTEEDENVIDPKIYKGKKLFKENKFVGDLFIPYKGIKNNVSRIDFVIYGINKKNMKNSEWINCENKEELIQIGFILSVY